jgi:hypothetical protein
MSTVINHLPGGGLTLYVFTQNHERTLRLLQLPCRGGHFLKDDISKFDAPFFSMSSTEAKAMDPQLRGLLEVMYCAMENGTAF